jgi:hypothetical protein
MSNTDYLSLQATIICSLSLRSAPPRSLSAPSGFIRPVVPTAEMMHLPLRQSPQEVRRALAGHRHYLFRLSNLRTSPTAKTMNRNPALESASARIVSLAIPKLSCAMVPNRTATVAAESNNDKMEVITRPIRAQ